MAKKSLIGLIVITAAVFSFSYAAAQVYGFVAVAVGLGAAWLTLEVKREHRFATAFFLAFVALAVLASLKQASPLIVLLGLTTDLAAWDLSRFRRRIAGEAEGRSGSIIRDQASSEAGGDRLRRISDCAAAFAHSTFDQLRRPAVDHPADRDRPAAVHAGYSRWGQPGRLGWLTIAALSGDVPNAPPAQQNHQRQTAVDHAGHRQRCGRSEKIRQRADHEGAQRR